MRRGEKREKGGRGREGEKEGGRKKGKESFSKHFAKILHRKFHYFCNNNSRDFTKNSDKFSTRTTKAMT